MNRIEIARVVVAPGIALFIAVVGWVLAERYNTTQLEVAAQRSDADVEIARINAALRYMEFLRDVPEANTIQRRQAVAIAAPVLPPDLAFRLAVDQLPDDHAALDALMLKHGGDAYTYLARDLEVPFRNLKRVLDPVPETGPFAVQPTERERRASAMLRYLRERGYSQRLFEHLTSGNYDNREFRATALLLYFDDYRQSLEDDTGYDVQEAYGQVRVEEEFQSYLDDESLSVEAKQALAFSASVVFGRQYEPQSDLFTKEAADRFWEGVDTARGVTPVEGSLQSYIYDQVFHYNDLRRDAVDFASASLRDALRSLNVRQLDFDNVRLILYAYAASTTVADEPAYLAPWDLVEVTRTILDWANSPKKRQDLSMMLGSLSGDHLFLGMLPSALSQVNRTRIQVRARCSSARAYAEILLKWYQTHHVADWYIPKFFDSVANEFPDLEDQIERDAWGLGGPWELEASRGCRKMAPTEG